MREASAIGRDRDLLVVPSVKYHLPAPGESSWREEEYQFTTRAIVDAHAANDAGRPIAIEKDFSPTLAGSARSLERRQGARVAAPRSRLDAVRGARGGRHQVQGSS